MKCKIKDKGEIDCISFNFCNQCEIEDWMKKMNPRICYFCMDVISKELHITYRFFDEVNRKETRFLTVPEDAYIIFLDGVFKVFSAESFGYTFEVL